MILYIEGEPHEISVSMLQSDLVRDALDLVTISRVGELVVDTGYGVYEVYQAMPVGMGADNVYWGDWEGGYEFCRTVKVSR